MDLREDTECVPYSRSESIDRKKTHCKCHLLKLTESHSWMQCSHGTKVRGRRSIDVTHQPNRSQWLCRNWMIFDLHASCKKSFHHSLSWFQGEKTIHKIAISICPVWFHFFCSLCAHSIAFSWSIEWTVWFCIRNNDVKCISKQAAERKDHGLWVFGQIIISSLEECCALAVLPLKYRRNILRRARHIFFGKKNAEFFFGKGQKQHN